VRTSIQAIQAMKAAGAPIVMLTSYDFTSAQIADRAGVPLLLVGDSLGMVVLGYGSTLPVTLDDMVRHAGAVVRGSANALIVGDLPFLTYASEADAVRAAGRMMQEAGVQAVKLEGGAAMAPVVKKLVELGVPVMGHLGYTPQSTLQIGIRVQAKDDAGAETLIADALGLQAAGAFAIVLELIPHALAAEVSRRLTIPTIGIGAGPDCDGQVQVWHDILGLYGDRPPKHAKVFGEIGKAVEAAVTAYVDEVGAGRFPPRKAARPAETLKA